MKLVNTMMRNHQSGFSLIEVLISVFILAVGLLGAASLQMRSLQQEQSAYFRSQATLMAYDMADRMRSNTSGLASGFYDEPTAADNNCSLLSATSVGAVTACTPQQMARNDMYEWAGNGTTINNIANILPNGSAIVCLDSTPEDGTAISNACDGIGSVYAIKIWWSDDRSQENANDRIQRFVTTVSF